MATISLNNNNYTLMLFQRTEHFCTYTTAKRILNTETDTHKSKVSIASAKQ